MGQNHPYTMCQPCQVARMGLSRKAVCRGSGTREEAQAGFELPWGRLGPDVMPGRARVSRAMFWAVVWPGWAGCSRVLGGREMPWDGKMQRRRLTGDEGAKKMEVVAGGRVDGKVDAGDRQTVRLYPSLGLAVCYATVGRATCRGECEGKGRGEDEGDENGRRRVCYGRKIGYPGLPFPVAPIAAVMVPSVLSSPAVQKVWDCANHDGSYQTVAVSERQVLDGSSSHSSPTDCNPWMCGVEEGTSWCGEDGQGGFPRPQFGGVKGPTNNGTPSLDPCASVCAPQFFPFEQVCHLSSSTRSPQHHNTRTDITVQTAARETRCWLFFLVPLLKPPAPSLKRRAAFISSRRRRGSESEPEPLNLARMNGAIAGFRRRHSASAASRLGFNASCRLHLTAAG